MLQARLQLLLYFSPLWVKQDCKQFTYLRPGLEAFLRLTNYSYLEPSFKATYFLYAKCLKSHHVREVISWQPQFVSERRRGGGGGGNLTMGYQMACDHPIPPSSRPPFLFPLLILLHFVFANWPKFVDFRWLLSRIIFAKFVAENGQKFWLKNKLAKTNMYFAKTNFNLYSSCPISASACTPTILLESRK